MIGLLRAIVNRNSNTGYKPIFTKTKFCTPEVSDKESVWLQNNFDEVSDEAHSEKLEFGWFRLQKAIVYQNTYSGLSRKLTKNRNFHHKTYRHQNQFHLKLILTEFYLDLIRKNTIPKGYGFGIRPLAETDNVKLAKLHFDNKWPWNYRNQNPTVSKFFLPEF